MKLLPSPGVAARAGARGLVAAMAMTGLRRLTENLGLLEESPPKAIAEQHAPGPINRLVEEHRAAVTELAHWTYGMGGGLAYSALPDRIRAHPLTGPVYGLAVWLSFELGVAPLLGMPHARSRRPVSRLVLAFDHVLYGIVVAARLAPDPQVIRDQHRRYQGRRCQKGTSGRRRP